MTRIALFLLLIAAPARADVVISEIMYHAPEDLDKLQFVELHNTSPHEIEISGWRLAKGVHHTLANGTTIPSQGFLVICRDAKTFHECYGFDAAGTFEGAFPKSGGQLQLLDSSGRLVDSVRFKSRSPWPTAADGCSSSLERICPAAPGDDPNNWAASPLAKGTPKPGGSPGKQNTVYASHLPPVIANVKVSPPSSAPNQSIQVLAEINANGPVKDAEVIVRVCHANSESDDTTIAMTRKDNGRYSATIPGQAADRIVRIRIRAVDAQDQERIYPHPNELRPAISVWVHEQYHPGKIPFGHIINVGRREFRTNQLGAFRSFGPPRPSVPDRGNSAFVFVNQATGMPTLFDFVSVTPRNGGHKVHFHKDRPFDGMTTINLVHEGHDRFLLAEPLAYEVYRKAGNAACRTDFVRTWLDGKPLGYHLLIEQPNKSFLRRNQIRTDGNLYKCVWFGRTLVGQHEKKTQAQEGHDDLKQLIEELNRSKDDEQWAVIKKHFDVEQVINYFAVNMVISHWDGFFNNYFTYHNVHGTGKWTMYPWDQDKTWGFHDGIRGDDVFTDMPLTFGMAGDVPPGLPRDRPPPEFFGAGAVWWRPGGYFSKPLLANPTFRKLFLARTKEILETVYTEDVFFPRIKALGEQLEDEVRVRAQLMGANPNEAAEHLHRNLNSLRAHLTKRRKWLLEQEEIKSAGAFDRTLIR